jgi:hypothetical protein
MPSPDELNAAVGAGVIGRADADRLAAFLAERRGAGGDAVDDPAGDAEAIRFVRGFHDVFLTIGVILLLTGIGYSAQILASGLWPYPVAIAAWLLAEYFTRAKRLTLPSIVLSIAFGMTGGLALTAIAAALLVAGPLEAQSTFAAPGGGRLRDTLAPFAMLAASLIFYLRFRLPFTLAQMVVAAAVAIGFSVSAPFQASKLTFLIMGVATFMLALYYDLKDPERRTIAADNAFWLHLTAAPLIVHTVIGFVWADTTSNLTLPAALATMAVIFGLALIALIIDRRALLVAGLFYFGAALFIVIRNTAIEEGAVFAVTILILGGALLLLGIGWRPVRRAVVTALMPPEMALRLPTVRPE